MATFGVYKTNTGAIGAEGGDDDNCDGGDNNDCVGY